MDEEEFYESVKSSLYVVWSLLFAVAAVWIMDYKGFLPGEFRMPSEVYVYGTAVLMSMILGFTIVDRMRT